MKIPTKLVRSGNGYAFTVPKAFIDAELISPYVKYKITIEEVPDENRKNAVCRNYAHSDNFSRREHILFNLEEALA